MLFVNQLLFRPRDWQPQARRRKRILAKAAWFRPADTVIKVPYTPKSALASMVRQVVQEEGGRLGLQVKVQEGGGISLKSRLVTSDLTAGEPCRQGDCVLCLTGEGKGGNHHHRSGAVYKGECKHCGDTVTARYWGESGNSVYCRTRQHVQNIRDNDDKNAFSKHLQIYHPAAIHDVNAFKFSLEGTYTHPVVRQITESVYIHNNNVDIPMNSKSQWFQPMEERVVVTRELEELRDVDDSRRSSSGSRNSSSSSRNRRGGV